jgi:hypothetical protein
MFYNYKKLPEMIECQNDLYQLMICVSNRFRAANYRLRLSFLGITPMDIANSLFLKFLEGLPENRPHRKRKRIPVVKGKKTRRAKQLRLPIEKQKAYRMLTLDAHDFIRKKTKEENARINLISLNKVVV